MNTLLISALIIIAYGIALALKANDTFKNKNITTGSTVMLLLCVCLFSHAYVLYIHIMHHPQGINLGFYNISSLVSWFILVISWSSIIRRIEVDNSLFFIVPHVHDLFIIQRIFSSSYYPKDALSTSLIIHIVLSILAYSILSIACIQALLLFAQEANLKNQRNINRLRWLPSLETMEDLLFNLITLGLILLSIAIATGALYIEDVFAQHMSHKLVFTLISWLIFTALLAGRYFYGWRGITAIKWTIAGFIALMLAYFGSKFVLEVILIR